MNLCTLGWSGGAKTVTFRFPIENGCLIARLWRRHSPFVFGGTCASTDRSKGCPISSMTWYQTQTGRVHYQWVWQYSFNAGGERWFALMWARLILTDQLVEFDTPARGYSYAHLCVKISASVSFFCSTRSVHAQERASTDIVLVCDRLIVSWSYFCLQSAIRLNVV